MSDLSAVAYKSRATPQCSDVDVYYLLAQARSRNVSGDLSGVLLYDRGYFFQWVEGPSQQLRLTWDRIRADTRHTEIEVVFDGSRTFRLFEGWHMQLAHRDKEQQRTVRDSLNFDASLLDELHQSPQAMPELFAAFGTAGGLVRHGPTRPLDAMGLPVAADHRINQGKRFARFENSQKDDLRLSALRQANVGEKLQRAGSAARAAGIGSFMNPFYQHALMPAQTGESVRDWQVKVEAWDQGWLMEDAVSAEQA